eukprot:SAG11_NODE_32652_length_281_cov_23.065934_1_plen_62_part_10
MHLLSLPAVLWSELVQYWDLLLALYFSYYGNRSFDFKWRMTPESGKQPSAADPGVRMCRWVG